MATILDHPLVSSRYFFPRRAPFADPYWIPAADGSRLACAYRAVRADATTVVYFHGNGEVVADYLPGFPDWLARLGHNVVLAEYRGYGMSTGHPSLVAMLDDVSAIIDHVGRLNIPAEKIVLFGRSIGSLHAVHGVSRHPQLAGVIIESGVADLTERFFQRVAAEELGVPEADVRKELRAHFDHGQKLGGFQGRTLILHARHDDLLPAQQAELLYAAAREPKELKIFDRGGHNDIFFQNREAYMGLVEAFLAAVGGVGERQ